MGSRGKTGIGSRSGARVGLRRKWAHKPDKVNQACMQISDAHGNVATASFADYRPYLLRQPMCLRKLHKQKLYH